MAVQIVVPGQIAVQAVVTAVARLIAALDVEIALVDVEIVLADWIAASCSQAVESARNSSYDLTFSGRRQKWKSVSGFVAIVKVR